MQQLVLAQPATQVCRVVSHGISRPSARNPGLEKGKPSQIQCTFTCGISLAQKRREKGKMNALKTARILFCERAERGFFFLAQLCVVRHAPPNTQATQHCFLFACLCLPSPSPSLSSSLLPRVFPAWVLESLMGTGGEEGRPHGAPPPHSPPTLACISSMTTRPGGVSSPFCGIHLRPAHPAPPRPQRTRGQGQQHPSPTALARALVVLPLPLPSPSPWLRRALLLASPPPTRKRYRRAHPPPAHPPTTTAPHPLTPPPPPTLPL